MMHGIETREREVSEQEKEVCRKSSTFHTIYNTMHHTISYCPSLSRLLIFLALSPLSTRATYSRIHFNGNDQDLTILNILESFTECMKQLV